MTEFEQAKLCFLTGLDLLHSGDYSGAEKSLRQADALVADRVSVLTNLSFSLLKQGEISEAKEFALRSVAVDPENYQGWTNLAYCSISEAGFSDAVAQFEKALAIQPDYVEACTGLGVAFNELGQSEQAEAILRKALSLKPDCAEACCNLGNVLAELARLEEAEASFRRALEIMPDFAEAHSGLGATLYDLGRSKEAEANYRRALEIKPDFSQAHSDVIFRMDLSGEENMASVSAERRRWGARHAEPLYCERLFSNTTDLERRLRIGYVSADFRQHSAALVFEVMLLHFDRRCFEVFAYSNSTQEDATTLRFKQSVTCWRRIAGQSDEAVADLILQDQIDILVDLSGHTTGNRLLVFARKPAPIQVTAWGYATGTGVKTIDYFMTDAVMVPPEEHAFYVETIRYLPSAVCFSSDRHLPSVNSLPALQKRGVTLGSFNRLGKISDAAIIVWARILRAIPDGKLVLKSAELENAPTRAWVMANFSSQGVAAERIQLLGKTNWFDHMMTFNQIDIALDPFPHGGGVTTLEGLLMGVPAITLRGKTITGRLGASILTTLGLTDWIAETESEYVQLAINNAHACEALASLRSELRSRFQNSVLGDAKSYLKLVEMEYRELWQEWVKNSHSREH